MPPVVKGLELLSLLVEHSGVDLSRQEIVSRRDGVDVSRQMQVELVHRNNLRVSAARGTAFDPESRSLGRLPHARKDILV